MEEKEVKQTKTKKNMILQWSIIIVLILVILVAAFIIYTKLTKKGNETLSYGDIEVTYDIPENFELFADGNATKIYMNENKDETLQYSIYLDDSDGALAKDKELVEIMRKSSDYTSIQDEVIKFKKNGKELTGYKYDTVDKYNQKSSSLLVYYPKGDFIVSIGYFSEKNITVDDILKYITIY